MNEHETQKPKNRLTARQVVGVGAMALGLAGPIVHATIGENQAERQQHAVEAVAMYGEEALAGVVLAGAAKVKAATDQGLHH